MPGSTPFIPGPRPARPGPLARFLPPLPQGVAAAWLVQHLPLPAQPDTERPWVLDPFGAAPRLAVEAAQAGYRVLVAANNPVARFLLELTARPPAESELRAALADLAASYKGEERIEPHIRGLYRTECAQCQREITADAFLWDRGAPAPFARVYHCPHCGDSGEHSATEADVARAARFSSGGLHRARALERVAGLDDPDRQHVEEALSTYLPRAVYALFTLINKLDNLPPARVPLLAALLLSACDQANTLWPHPTLRARPRQLTIPPRFREKNVWLALEEAIEQWCAPAGGASAPLPLTIWPDLPPAQGGICLFEGRLKALGEASPGPGRSPLRIGAVLTALPRPNQAYWTLSALWAGWLWGRAAAAPFKSVLRRRRYDWAWHSTALHAAFSNLDTLLEPGAPVFGLVAETEPGFLSAALLAAAQAGLELTGLALRGDEDQAQVTWQWSGSPAQPEPSEGAANRLKELAQAAAQDCLRSRGEPSPYLHLHAAALRGLAHNLTVTTAPAETLSQVQATFQNIFSFRGGFVRFGGSEHSLEAGQWWLRSDIQPAGGSRQAGGQLAGRRSKTEAPLADRVEMALVRFLQKRSPSSFAEIDAALCVDFPGLLTPERSLLRACLDSYAEETQPGSNQWRLRSQDSPQARRRDLAGMVTLLEGLAARLGYKTSGHPSGKAASQTPGDQPWRQPLVWSAPSGEVRLVFYLVASAVIGKVLLEGEYPARQSLLVYPGSRAGLIAHKLRSDPRLNQAIEAGWRLVKFRHLRRLAETQDLNHTIFEVQLNLDPLTNTDPQMPLL